jgi:hypothetical protein
MQNEYVAAVKSHASILIDHLAKYGIKLKKTQALEVISNLQNQRDWNRVRAKLCGNDIAGKELLTPAIKPEFQSFSLIGCMGTGKTEAMKTLFNLEQADGASFPIYVCLSGGAHIYGHAVDEQLHAARWTVSFSASGSVDVKQPSVSMLHGKAQIVNFVGERRGSRIGLGAAFKNFFEQQGEALARHAVGSLFVDEFHGLDSDDEKTIIQAVHVFSDALSHPIRRLVIASQTPFSHGTMLHHPEFKHLVEARYTSHVAQDFAHTSVGDGFYSQGLYQESNWESQSMDDPRIVEDVFRTVTGHIHTDPVRKSDESRMKHVLGQSLWFRDLRNSLIR